MAKKAIKQTFWEKIKKYIPAALVTFTSWLPSETAKPSITQRDSLPKNNIEKLAHNQNKKSAFYLALADKGSQKAYSKSIAQISIATESQSINPANPAAVATGNGYYGQHQFGVSSASGYMVKKYIAYALVYGSDEFRKSLSDKLLLGNAAKKEKLIKKFMTSVNSYESKGKLEDAFLPNNPDYKNLFDIMSVDPTRFKAAHKNFAKEGFEQQKMFVYDVYLNLMPTGFNTIVKKHPKIAFDEIHPATWGAVIAIAVKQGNGKKFDAALTKLERESKSPLQDYQEKLDKQWKTNKNGKRPLVVSIKNHKISAENIVAQGEYTKKTVKVKDKSGKFVNKVKVSDTRQLLVYDPTGKLNKNDIQTSENGRDIVIIHNKKPDTVQSNRNINITTSIRDKIDVSELNTSMWLEEYCGSKFRKVYKEAKPLLDKVPTIDTYYEMSIFLRMPDLYKKVTDFIQHNHQVMPSTIAFHDAMEMSPSLKERTTKDKEKILQLKEMQNSLALTTPSVRKRASVSDNNSLQILKRIKDNRLNRG